MDSFEKMEFWYVDQGIQALETDGSSSLCKVVPRQKEKWWLPVPRVPTGGLCETARKNLQSKRDSTNQILKAAMAINSITLADIDVPESYLESLPKVYIYQIIRYLINSQTNSLLNILKMKFIIFVCRMRRVV